MSNIVDIYQDDCKYRKGTKLYIKRYKGKLIEGASGIVVTEEDVINRYNKSIDTLLRQSRTRLFGPIIKMADISKENYIFFHVTKIVEYDDDELFVSTTINNILGKIVILSKEDNEELNIVYRVIP